MADPVCPLDDKPMKRWYFIPTDAVSGKPNAFGQIYRCDHCKYAHISPMPSKEQVNEFYRLERYYTHGQTQFERGHSVSLLDRVRQHLAWRADFGTPMDTPWVLSVIPKDARTVCDLGCGSGELAAELADAGLQVTGVEPDPDAVAHTRRGKFELISASAEGSLDILKGRTFDVIVMRHVLEHCIDPNRVLTNAAALLNAQGLLVCEVPNNTAQGLRQSGAAWLMLDVPRHLHFFTGPTLVAFCRRARLDVVSTSYAGYSRQFSNDWIATERRSWERLMDAAAAPQPRPRRNSKVRAWLMLAATALVPADRKYDSVRVIARRGIGDFVPAPLK